MRFEKRLWEIRAEEDEIQKDEAVDDEVGMGEATERRGCKTTWSGRAKLQEDEAGKDDAEKDEAGEMKLWKVYNPLHHHHPPTSSLPLPLPPPH